MKPKYFSILFVLTIAAANLLVYQNCSKVDVSALPDSMSKAGNNVALATDDDGNLIPVQVNDASDLVGDEYPEPNHASTPEVPSSPAPQPAPEEPMASQPAPPAEGEGEVSAPGVTVEIPAEGDMVAACGLNLKTIHRIVDLAQFKDQDVNLSLLQGKTLVYSSDPTVSLKSLNIETAVGRTILCGCKVDRLDVKKGRLEVYKSEIKSIGVLKGNLIKGEGSILPAGY